MLKRFMYNKLFLTIFVFLLISGTGFVIIDNYVFAQEVNNAPLVSNLEQHDDVDGQMSEGATTYDVNPYFTFIISDPDSGDTVGYQIQVDDSSNFGSPVINYTWNGSTTNPNDITYNISSQLSEGDYYWRIRARDGDGLYSAWADDNNGYSGSGFDFRVVIPEKCDVSRDGSITEIDMDMVSDAYAGSITLDAEEEVLADADENGSVQLYDATLIGRTANGLEPPNCDDPDPLPDLTNSESNFYLDPADACMTGSAVYMYNDVLNIGDGPNTYQDITGNDTVVVYYQVFRDGSQVYQNHRYHHLTLGAGSSFESSDLFGPGVFSESGSYVVRVTLDPYDQETESNESNNVKEITFDCLDPNTPPTISLSSPSNDSTCNSYSSLNLTWDGDDADGDSLTYYIYTCEGSSCDPDTLQGGGGISSESYTLSNLSENTVYRWKVKAYDGEDETYSSIWRFTTEQETPTYTITDPVNTSWNTSDIVAISWSDDSIGYNALSDNSTCNASDNFDDNDDSRSINSTYTGYMCFKTTTACGTTVYSSALGPLKVDTTFPSISNVEAHCDSYVDNCEQDDDTEIYFTWAVSDEHSGVSECFAELNDSVPDEDAGIDGQDTDTGLEGLNTYYVRCRDNIGYYSSTLSDTINISLDSDAPGIDFNPTSREWDDQDVGVVVTASDPSGITYTRHCWTTSSSCDPGSSSSSTFTNGSSITRTSNGDWNLCIRARDSDGNWNQSAICSGRYSIDKNDPTVDAFTVDGNTTDFTTEDTNLNIAWTVSDTGGSGLDKTEVWRKKNSSAWVLVWTDDSTTGSSDSGSWTNEVTCGHSYEYGIHVLDTAENQGTESESITVIVDCPTDPDFSISRFPSSRIIDQGDSTNYTISLTEINGFSSSVSLSASNCPSGANCTFNPSSVVPTNDSVLSIYDAPVGGPYTITISATGGGKTHDTSVTLTVNEEEGEGEGGGGGGENTIPNDPINLAQFEDAGALTESQSTDDTTPYFTFDVSDPDTNDIIGYQIQIDNDSNFSSPIIDFEYIDDDITPQSFVYQVPSTCPGSGYIACTTPLTDENYYWQVRAKDNGGEYSYWVEFGTEEVIDFIVNTVVVGAPTAEFSACRVAGNAILFFDESTDVGGTIDEWDWDFGDETSHSSLQNPQHDYDTGDTSMLDGATRIAGAKEVRGEEENKKLRNEEIEENKNIQIQKKQKKSVFKKAWEFIKNLFKTKKSSADSWWDENWTKRRKIVFNNSSSSENLNNVPVLVVLNSGNIDYGQTQDNGEDIRFVDSNDSTELNYEIEDWNESGNSYVWVKVPRVNKNSNSDFIYIYYGNNSASDNQNKTSVWNNDYGLVWHMEGDGTIISDSSGNRSDTTLLNTWTWNSGGKISDTLYMMSRPINTGIWPRSTGIYDGSDLTLSFWVKGISSAPTSNWADQFVVTSGRWSGLTIGNQGNPPDPYIKFTDYNNGAGRDLNTTYFGNSGFDLYTLSIDWNGGSGDDARFWLYKNGSLVDTFDQEQDSYPGMIYLGTEEDLAQSGTYVDEFRISETVRSGEWIEAQYRIMTNSFNSFEDEESTEPTVFNVTLVATDNDSSTDSETKELNLTAMTLDGSDIDDCDFSFDLTNLSSSGCNLVSAEWDLSLIYDESGDYVVDRCTSGCSSFNNYSSISPAKSCSELGCSFDDATTDSNTTYSYIISNPDSLNNSTISPSCNGAQQPSGTICPLSVTTLVCEPESVSTSHVCGSISLQWLEDENVSYDIKRCVGKQSGVECTPEDLLYEFLVEDCAGGVCEYMDEEIIPINIATPADENYYCYGIVGIDGEGLESSMSDIVCDYSYCYRAPNWQEQ